MVNCCVVCYETNNKFINAPYCNHNLCRICFKRLNKKICPICRMTLKKIRVNNNIKTFVSLTSYYHSRNININKLKSYVFSKEWKNRLETFLHLRYNNQHHVFYQTKMININSYPFENGKDDKIYKNIDDISLKQLATIIFFLHDTCCLKKLLVNELLFKMVEG